MILGIVSIGLSPRYHDIAVAFSTGAGASLTCRLVFIALDTPYFAGLALAWLIHSLSDGQDFLYQTTCSHLQSRSVLTSCKKGMTGSLSFLLI